MKKLLTIAFCLVYLVSSAGIHVNLHYCAGKIKSISFSHSDEADCCGTKMKKKDCCKEKTVTVQLKDNSAHSAKQLIVKPAQVAKDLIAVKDLPFVILALTETQVRGDDEPPDIGPASIFLSIRSLRI